MQNTIKQEDYTRSKIIIKVKSRECSKILQFMDRNGGNGRYKEYRW